MNRTLRALVRLVALATITAFLALGITVGSANAATPAGDCNVSNSLVKNMSVVKDPHDPRGTGFTVVINPTEKLRNAFFTGTVQASTNTVWHLIQGCQGGLYSLLADSIYQQLECHVIAGRYNPGTGPTFDLESRHAPLQDPNWLTYGMTRCGNGAEELPPAGWLDLAPPTNIA